MKQRLLSLFCRAAAALVAGFCLSLAPPAVAQSFLHADGTRIVNASNQEVLLNGVNLGGWMLQEGYIIKPGWQGINGRQTQGMVKKTLYNAGMSDADVETFYQSYRTNFIQKADIDYLASLGFNCLRLPLHYDLFLTPAQRAVRNGVLRGTVSYNDYVASLTTWYNQNQLFVDPANMEAFQLIDNVLGWAASNNMYVVLDLHAAPGSQGTETSIADALQPLDLWNQAIYQDMTERLWVSIAQRYRTDARVAMYDLINEPNSVPTNQQIRALLQRLINAVRAQNDNHLLLLEGNGFGNDFNWMEKRNFTNNANLVYNSHRYSGATYPLDNNLTSTDPYTANGLRFIGTMQSFRIANDVPIWVGETGENTPSWMHDAAVALNSVNMGWCHWTYKRFENGYNAALMHIPPPYIVDGPSGLPQVLQNIRFGGGIVNPSTVAAIAPNQNGIVNYPGGGSYNGLTAPPTQRIVWLQSSSGKYISSEGGYQPMTCTRSPYGLWEQWEVVAAGGGKVGLRSVATGGYASVQSGGNTLRSTATTLGTAEQFDWLINADGSISLRDAAGNHVSSENGLGPMTCNRPSIGGTEKFSFGIISAVLSTAAARPVTLSFYPNPVQGTLTYQLPAGPSAHRLTISDAAGRVVLTRQYGAAGPRQTVDVAPLRSGLYYVRLSGAGLNAGFKFSKD